MNPSTDRRITFATPQSIALYNSLAYGTVGKRISDVTSVSMDPQFMIFEGSGGILAAINTASLMGWIATPQAEYSAQFEPKKASPNLTDVTNCV